MSCRPVVYVASRSPKQCHVVDVLNGNRVFAMVLITGRQIRLLYDGVLLGDRTAQTAPPMSGRRRLDGR
jgi:hypothetical protein